MAASISEIEVSAQKPDTLKQSHTEIGSLMVSDEIEPLEILVVGKARMKEQVAQPSNEKDVSTTTQNIPEVFATSNCNESQHLNSDTVVAMVEKTRSPTPKCVQTTPQIDASTVLARRHSLNMLKSPENCTKNRRLTEPVPNQSVLKSFPTPDNGKLNEDGG
jgi:hypothetical protein